MKCTLSPRHPLPTSTMHKMSYEERMQKALDEIESSLDPNYAAIAKKYDLIWSTLSRRARGKTTSRAEF